MKSRILIPRLTLGLPVYNGERFLAASVDALLGQTFTDFELIISDNGSIDRTGEIARSYEAKDRRVRYVQQRQNRGASFNHNFVMSRPAASFSNGCLTTTFTTHTCSSGASRP